MYRSGSGRSGPSSSSYSHRLKDSGSAGSRASRSSTSGPGPGRGRPPPPPSPTAAATSASPPRRHRSPSGHRGASRRSPSPHRSRRPPSPPGGTGSGGTRGRRGSEHGDSGSRRRSPSLRSESSLEQSLRITVGNDRYCIGTPERRRLPDRLGSPIDNLSDRDDMADGPIFTRGLSGPRGLERYLSHEDQPSSPFSMRHDEDYRNRDVFLHRSDYSPHYGRREELPRGSDRDSDKFRKSFYPSRPEERGREIKRPRYEKDEKLHCMSGEHQGFSSGTRNYRRRSRSLSRSRSPSPSYLNEEFRELDRARRKREEEERNRNLNHDVSDSGYVIPGLTNTLQTSEPRYTYRPEEIPSMPKKSILKKRVEMEVESPIQPEEFSSSPAPSKDLPLLSSHSSLPQSNNTAPFSSEVENFLKRFNKDSVMEPANKELHDGLYEWNPLSAAPKDTFTYEEKFGSFLSHKEKIEPKSEPADRHTDFLLPHERASQDGSGFSRILGMMADSVSAQEKRRRSFPDIEDEEKFLYGDEDEDTNTESHLVQKPPVSCSSEVMNQKVSLPPPSPAPAVKLDPLEESNAEYAKIHDLLKTIGLDIGVAEIGRLAIRTQERLHGKKLASRSPDRRSSDTRRTDRWDLRRSRSDTRSPESGQQHSASPPISFQQSKDPSSLQKSEYTKNKPGGQDVPPCAPEQPLPSVSLIPSVPPAPASLPPTPTSVSQYQIPNYSQFTTTQMPPNYPPPTLAPPGYDAYGHYMAYAAPGWTMYPPTQQPNPALPEAHGLLTMAMSANPTRPNLRVIETVSMRKDAADVKRDGSVLVRVPTTPTHSKVPLRPSSHPLKSTPEKISDEKNRAAQKQKVIEEREKLKNEREARQKKLYYLKTELDRLRKQQGEMLRKKRREKDGHKDPLLVEVNRLQENIVKEISELHKESDAADKKQSELDKVAQILGINIFEKPRKPSVETKDSSEKNSKSENTKGLEKATSSNKESKPTNEKSRGRSPKPAESSSQSSKHPFQLANIYEYYDAGNHWCKDCNTICGTMFDFFTHMHNKKHRQTLDPYNRPWASKTQSETKQDSIKRIDKITVPAKGSEFLIPITGYYCQLCHEFFGDQISAEQHVKSHPHNEKYKKYIDENPLYEERRNLDRQAGLAVVLETERRRQNELKRKLVEKQKEEKDEKKAKIIKKEETKNTPELGEGASETQDKTDSSGRKMGIKLKLKKEEKKEDKKEEKKEESKKESPSQTSFGKFSWKKAEREDKAPGVAIPKEESTEGNKEENKFQSGKLHAKSIEIKLSGKTVIPHTSPWTPVAYTSTQSKILPNLPVPTMIFRKSTTATVSKPAPLNTFLSIKSSGATTKPLPVVKETNADLLLPPDIISKAFGGEEVILKGPEEDLKAPEKSESSQTSDIPPPPPPPPAVQPTAVIPADEVAPGVSESEQTMLAMPVRPPPPPPPSTAFSEQAKKIEKRNSCLATANAKDLYDIFYSSGGKGSADSKLVSSTLPNGENSNLAKPADYPANSRTDSSLSSFKEESQNVATEVSQAHSAETGSVMEKTDFQETLIPNFEMSADTESGIQKDVGKKFQALTTDIQIKLKDGDSLQCSNQVMGSWILGENHAERNKKIFQPQLSEMSVTELLEAKPASHIQMPAEKGLVDIASQVQAGSKEFCDLQRTEIQERVEQDDANEIAVSNSNASGILEKDKEMKDREIKAVKPELMLEQIEIQNLGDPHLEEENLSDSCRTASETHSPHLLSDSQNISKEKLLLAVLTEQNSIDASLKGVNPNSVALEVPGVLGKTHQISETQNKISELTRSPAEWDASRTSKREEQVMATSSCSESGWKLSNTPNVEKKNNSNKISASELTEIEPEASLSNTKSRSSTLEAQEKVRPELSGHAVLDKQTQRQEVAWLVNACSASIVELRSSVEFVVEVEKKSLGHTGSNEMLDDIFAKRDAKEGMVGFSDLVQESAVALSADFNQHFSEEAVNKQAKSEAVRTSAANDFSLNTTHSGFNTKQSESLSLSVSEDNKKDSLRSENTKCSETPSEKAEQEFKSTDFNLGNTKTIHEDISILPAGLLNTSVKEVSKLETIASVELESNKLGKLGIGKTVDETEVTDFATLTSGSWEDKLCTQVSQTAASQLGLQPSNNDTMKAVMPVPEMQGISTMSESLRQVEESRGGAAEMLSLSCDGDSRQSPASGCVETFLPGLKETHGKEDGLGGKGLCAIQSKKTEQTETTGSSSESTTNSGMTESLAESPVG
ncbi:zinc finger protein 318 [Centrocercus urophasianus]|uniref:zinc finger protein 318 n=1 Tax=Centrocercus urophasianus TaxID=9002 RepID=UPI001C647263|nr:zinc finger protein 318 [Centrocercus urophasianus]